MWWGAGRGRGGRGVPLGKLWAGRAFAWRLHPPPAEMHTQATGQLLQGQHDLFLGQFTPQQPQLPLCLSPGLCLFDLMPSASPDWP